MENNGKAREAWLERYVMTAIESTTRETYLADVPLSTREAVSLRGGLPIFMQHAQFFCRLMTGDIEKWMGGFEIREDDDSLLGCRVVCRDVNIDAGYPFVGLLMDGVKTACRMSPPNRIELATIIEPKLPEIMSHVLSINSWQTLHSAAEAERRDDNLSALSPK